VFGRPKPSRAMLFYPIHEPFLSNSRTLTWNDDEPQFLPEGIPGAARDLHGLVWPPSPLGHEAGRRESRRLSRGASIAGFERVRLRSLRILRHGSAAR
jgi:hypothetical protein